MNRKRGAAVFSAFSIGSFLLYWQTETNINRVTAYDERSNQVYDINLVVIDDDRATMVLSSGAAVPIRWRVRLDNEGNNLRDCQKATCFAQDAIGREWTVDFPRWQFPVSGLFFVLGWFNGLLAVGHLLSGGSERRIEFFSTRFSGGTRDADR